MQTWKCRACGNETITIGFEPEDTSTGACDHRLVLAYYRENGYESFSIRNRQAHRWVRMEDFDPSEFALMTRSERAQHDAIAREIERRTGDSSWFTGEKKEGFLQRNKKVLILIFVVLVVLSLLSD